jgi:DNA-binding MarR family transcriptional regulator
MNFVYARTQEGQEAAYSAQSALPRKLKSILKVIDGKTRTQVFEQNLSSFGDVQAILRSLEMAGLIQSVSNDAKQIRFNLELDEAERSKLKMASNNTDWAATRNPLDRASYQPDFSIDNHSQTFASKMPDSLTLAAEQKKTEVLAGILDAMSHFVLTHAPEQSFQILKEIEEISSLEILAATLGGYEQMISHLGENSTQHMRHIKSTLRDNL